MPIMRPVRPVFSGHPLAMRIGIEFNGSFEVSSYVSVL